MKNLIGSHLLKKKAKGRPVVMVPLFLYSDDFSGNKTKKWNCFNAWCLMLAGLPKQCNAQHNIHLICASNKVPVLQMAQPIVELLLLQEGIEMYDAHLQQDVFVIAPVLAFMGDNPRASEVLGHLLGSSNKFCRQCMVSTRIFYVLLHTVIQQHLYVQIHRVIRDTTLVKFLSFVLIAICIDTFNRWQWHQQLQKPN